MNEVERYRDVFEGIAPWSGTPPREYVCDWLGVLTRKSFRVGEALAVHHAGGEFVQTRRPTIETGEIWFEQVNWVEAAREARDRFVMVTLGACYGAQAVGSYVALQKLNPMPCRVVAVEPEPDNMRWISQHFRDNGIDPGEHWLLECALSDSNAPVFFPVGSPGSGAQNCFSTNERAAREFYLRELVKDGGAETALRNLLIGGTTGIKKDLVPGQGLDAEIKPLSAITLRDVLAPLGRIDYLEADMQQSEIVVFPPFMDLVKRKVRRVHIGTHGRDVHHALAELLRRDGWTIVFDYEPNATFETPLGSFATNDGILTATNDTVLG